MGIFNKTMTPLALDGYMYEIVLASSVQHVCTSLAIDHLIPNARSRNNC